MDIVLKINDREALAVWTIPYMTSWRLSPDMLLERLTGTASRFPQAFNLGRNGNPIKLTHSQWDELEDLVNKFESHLSNQNLPEHEDRLAWKTESIELFWHYEPSYLWLDEFEDWYYNRFIANFWAAEPNEDTRLSFNPQLPPEHIKHFEQNDFKSATSLALFDNQSVEQLNEIDQTKPVESEFEANIVAVSGEVSHNIYRESQFYALVWRVYQFLTSNGKAATAQKVWDEIRFRPESHDIDKIIDKGRSRLSCMG